MPKPISLYGSDVWGLENIEQIEDFHRINLGRLHRVRKGTRKEMTNEDLGNKYQTYNVASFSKSLSYEKR